MKQRISAVLIFFLIQTFLVHSDSKAQVSEVITGLAKKVIKAIDLQVQRLQNATIKLQNAQQEVQNVLSKLKLNEISEWAKKQKELYKNYYDELWKIKTALSYYKRIRQITENQISLVKEYKTSFSLFKRDKNFTPEELKFIGDVYSGILEESLKNVDLLLLAVKSFATQMSDAQRLELIETSGNNIDDNLVALRRFNSQNSVLSAQRRREKLEIEQMKKLYEIK